MKSLKITSVLLSAAMCMSFFLMPASVIADETEAPSETQATEAAESEETKATVKKETEKETVKKTEKETEKETEAETEKATEKETEKPTEKETEPSDTAPAETGSEDQEETSEAAPTASSKSEPSETETKKPEETTNDANKEAVSSETLPPQKASNYSKNSVAYSGTYGNNLSWSLDTTGVLTISGNGKMTSYSMSDDVPWYYFSSDIKRVVFDGNISYIGDYAFSNCGNLTSIDLPKKLDQIGKYAFSGCSSLTSIVIPETVTDIYEAAFEDCTKLKTITLYESSHNLQFANSVFKGCTSLNSITLPKNVWHITGSLFRGCTNLKTVSILNNSLLSVGEYAFASCNNLESIVLPESVKTIGACAFANCTKLANFKIPNSITSIGRSAFNSCTSLSSISFPNNPITYESAVFCKCTSLLNVDGFKISGTKLPSSMFKGSGIKRFTIPNNIDFIDEEVFNSCENLTSIEIPSSVTYIGPYAFSYSRIKSIYIPKSVEKISSDAFSYCERLSSIVFEEKGEMYNTGTTVNDLGSFLKGCTGLANVAFADGELNEKNLSNEAKNLIHYYFDVYYSDDGHGTVTGKKRSCAGDSFEIVVTPDKNYELDKLKLTFPLPEVEISADTKGKFIITLPLNATGADIEATFKKIVLYKITVPDSLYGTVSVSPTKARAGEKITIIATPNKGYYLVGIKVNGSFINGTTFKMPSANVTIEAVFSVLKENTLKVKGGKTAKIKYKKLKKKAQTVSRAKVISVSNPQGKVTYSLVSVSKKKYKKYFKVNADTGDIKVKKKLKKGKYTIKCKVIAAGNDVYKPVTKTVTFKIKVK